MSTRPDFKEIKNYEEFIQYYWYRDELMQICKSLNLAHIGSKIELNHIIEEYYKGNFIRKIPRATTPRAKVTTISLSTPLLDCGFTFSQKFRDFFSQQTGVEHFKFNADMVATAKQVKLDKDTSFTLQDMLDIYYGKKTYVKYDKSACQWNQFLKDFCTDERTSIFSNKLQAATLLWTEIRNSTKEKVYTNALLTEYADILQGH